jgi:phosphatidylinositol alpha-1,6-mannosyltransferase
MKVLFITRKYPPQIGGMEKYSYDLIKNFSGQKEVIALKKSQMHLFWFIPYALVKGIFLSRKVDLIYLCDSLLAPVGLVLKLISKKPVMATAHGLDIIYNNWIYKNINVRSLKYLDKIIAISQATQKNCLACGVKPEKCLFIPNGINIVNLEKKYNKKDLSRFLKFNINNKKILLTIGRLTKRKGVAWFIKNVMPQLDVDIIYLIAGVGSEEKHIKEMIIKSGTMNQVIVLGKVTEDDKNMLFQTSDIFIMPNITKKNDQEGFGLSPLEASLVGLPVIASRIEGLTDSIIDNKNGYLVESKNINKFIEKINDILNSKDVSDIKNNFSTYTKENFDWKKIISEYEKVFETVLNKEINT